MTSAADTDAATTDTGVVAVIGTGYVGLTTAACLAHVGRTVVAIDIDEAKIETLRAGRIPIVEAGIEDLVTRGLATGRLQFHTDYEPCRNADVVLLCLPTPEGDHRGPDLRAVEAASRRLGPLLPSGAVVVTKSTVPVGTHRQIARWLDRLDVEVAANPEFLREGCAVEDFLHPDRIVVGAGTDAAARTVAEMYRGIDAPVLVTDPTSAELIKYAANTFLAAKLSFVNEMSRLCDALGAQIDDVVAGLGSDERIGPRFLQPGPGWGGSCFPKDTAGLAHIARAAGQYLPVVEAASDSNTAHLEHLTAEIVRLVPAGAGRIALWGATFKAGTDDLRESPALALADRLVERGSEVVIHDPVAATAILDHPSAADPYSACRDADLVVVATEWPEFGAIDLEKVAGELRGSVIYDTRAVIDRGAAKAAGLTIERPGSRR